MGISLEIWLTICLGFSGNGAYFVLMIRLVGPQQVMIWLVLWNMFFSIQLGIWGPKKYTQIYGAA